MPAVTADTLLLPKLSSPSVESRDRSVRSVTTAPQGFEGEGFPVRRAFAGVSLADLDPFIHMDQMVEVDYAPLFVAPHLPPRGHVPPSGLPWWWRCHRERRHPVDDRRWGDPPHRD